MLSVHERSGAFAVVRRKKLNGRDCAVKSAVSARHHQRLEAEHHRRVSAEGGGGFVVEFLGLAHGTDIVMPWYPWDLRAYLTAVPGASCSLKQRILHNVLLGLVQIHSAGLVHQDIKPENILLTCDQHGGVEAARIADFGSSVDEGTEQDGLGPCTLAYCSVEKLFGCRQRRTPEDLWACGMLLLALFAGRDGLGLGARGGSELAAAAAARELVGWAPDDDWAADLPHGFLARVPCPSTLPLDASPQVPHFRALLESLANPWPDRRATALEALESPFFDSVREQQ
ncbi:Protein kinase gsk31 [Diplonema papillatum]|nr:Protein kinase gsk31 [Diplonema papillatum]